MSLESFLSPPRGTFGDGSTSQPEKTLAEELAEETSLVHAQALKDCVTYLVENAINDAGIDVKRQINVRHNLRWDICDSLIARAEQYVGPAVEQIKASFAKKEEERLKFQELVGLFAEPFYIHKNADGPEKYDLLGLTESQLRLCAQALRINS